MKVLIVGGAGHVGRIIRPGLMREHECRFFDRVPVEGAEALTTIGDVNDEPAIGAALAGNDAVVFMPLGKSADGGIDDVDAAFDVNVKAMYRWLSLALDAGVQRFVQVSSLSIYERLRRRGVVTEEIPADAWGPYGLTKALAEQVCRTASVHYPDRTLVVLRLMLPTDDATWAEVQAGRDPLPPMRRPRYRLGPQDTTRLFLAAIDCPTPGVHILQASGDLKDEHFPNQRAFEVLGWRPRGE